MEHLINVSFSDFDNYLDFSEATIFIPSSFDKMSGFDTWGLTIHKNADIYNSIRKYSNLNTDEDLYISGYTEVIFERITSGHISIWLYNEEGTGFIKGQNNNKIKIGREWDSTGSDELPDKYYISCVTDWPYGFCEMELMAIGKLQLLIKTNNIVPISRYIQDTVKYDYKRSLCKQIEEGKSYT
jgi:hypothetical protein